MSNISAIVVVLLSLLTIVGFVVGLRSRIKAANRSARPLDLSAFRTLLDRGDEAFLQEKLKRAEFFRLKRLRIRVTWRYVRRIADNAAVVLHQAALSRQHPNPDVAESAAQVTDLASQIRVQCLVVFAKLAVEYALPSMQLTPAMLAPQYESLRQNVSRLGSLHPQHLAPLASAI